jgi:hypothetical protein
VRQVTDGHEVVVDVYTNTDYKIVLRRQLRAITVSGSALDLHLKVGSRVSLLGLFSVNLAKLLDVTASAHSMDEATAVPDALEFFIFGKPLQEAVSNSKCNPAEDGDDDQ